MSDEKGQTPAAGKSEIYPMKRHLWDIAGCYLDAPDDSNEEWLLERVLTVACERTGVESQTIVAEVVAWRAAEPKRTPVLVEGTIYDDLVLSCSKCEARLVYGEIGKEPPPHRQGSTSFCRGGVVVRDLPSKIDVEVENGDGVTAKHNVFCPNGLCEDSYAATL